MQEFSRSDWHRANRRAQLLCIGLPYLTPNDLLHEAIVQFLDGNRRCPRNVELLTSLFAVMRSVASHVRRRMKDGPIDHVVEVVSDYDDYDDEDAISNTAIPITFASPEKIVQDRESIAEIEKLFEGDFEVKALLHSWAKGNLGSDARFDIGLSSNKFEAAKKRLRRMLADLGK
jgi:hypothetical protein